MQKIYVCRHGETEWNITKRHTSFTDIALTKNGISQALALKQKLKNKKFQTVFTSPLSRAKQTCELAGFQGIVDADLAEWNYGDYEGLTTAQIQATIPDWSVFRYGCKGGESIEDVTKRAFKVIKNLTMLNHNILLFTHGHFSRVLIACWLGLTAKEGRFFSSSNTSLSILGYEHNEPILNVLNDTSHLAALKKKLS